MLQSQLRHSYTSSAYHDVLDCHVVLMHFINSLKNNWSISPNQPKLLSITHATAVHAGRLDHQERGQSQSVQQ